MSSEQERTADSFTKFILSIVATLLAGGVAALWVMTANVARIEERVGLWTHVFENRFEETTKNVRDLDRRMDRIELRQGIKPDER